MKTTKGLIFCTLFLLVLCAATAPAQWVTLWFTALEKDSFFSPGLAASDIEVREGKTTFPINRLTEKVNMPLEVLILFDASGSQKDLLDGEKEVADHFIENVLRKDIDKIAIVRFSAATELVCDLTADFDTARASLATIESDLPPGKPAKDATLRSKITPPARHTVLEKINSYPADEIYKSAKREAVTAVWGSTRWAIETFGAVKPTPARRVIILITDGMDTRGDHGFKEAVESSLKNQIPIFPIAMGDGILGIVSETWLVEFASQTGGTALLPQNRKRAGFAVDMRQIEQRLRNYYEVVIQTAPSGEKDKVRKIDVRITNDTLRKAKVRTFYPRGFTLN